MCPGNNDSKPARPGEWLSMARKKKILFEIEEEPPCHPDESWEEPCDVYICETNEQDEIAERWLEGGERFWFKPGDFDDDE